MGGSIALAVGGESETRLWCRRGETAERGRKMGITASENLGEVLEGSELTILAVPVGAMEDLLRKAIEAGLPAGSIVTDVGSVKLAPHRSLGGMAGSAGCAFIGSHPMAGSERNGLEAARDDLFQGAACLLTNDSRASVERCARLEEFWKHLGCHTRWMEAGEHDSLVARISHLPHITAAATARIALASPEDGKYGGGGLRDTTRVAAGNPTMWAEILTVNREAVLPVLRETIAGLREILASLEKADQELSHRWLADAKRLRDTLQ